jgi:Flp pilus assembly protein TadG
MLYRSRSRVPGRRAAAAVEAAVILPVLVFFMVAVVDLGRLGKVADSVSNAARNGAQYGSTSTTTAADSTHIRSAAVTEMSGLPKVTGTNPTVTATTATYTSGTATQQVIQVTVSYDMTGTAVFSLYPVNNVTRTVQMPMMPLCFRPPRR